MTKKCLKIHKSTKPFIRTLFKTTMKKVLRDIYYFHYQYLLLEYFLVLNHYGQHFVHAKSLNPQLYNIKIQIEFAFFDSYTLTRLFHKLVTHVSCE